MFGISEARIAWIEKKGGTMHTLYKIFEFDAADIENAARETDTTIMELLAIYKAENSWIDSATKVMQWVQDQSEAMLEMLEDEASDANECPVCRGASDPELSCYACSGSHKAAKDAAEAEYWDDMKNDEEWLRRNEA